MQNSIFDQLSFKTGHFAFKGIRYMLIRPDTIVDFQKAVEAAVGPEKCAEMMMHGGITGGSSSLRKYRKERAFNEAEIVRYMCQIGGELGWGDFQPKRFALAAGRLVVEVTDSPFAAAYGPSDVGVCHLIRGVLTGLGSSIFKGEVSSSETECLAKGDPRCRFEISKLKE